MSWYAKVTQDIAHLPDCLDHFYNELTQAKTEVKIHGSVEKASASLPGIVEHRFNQLQEIEAILESLNIDLRKIRSKLFRKYLESYARALSSNEVNKYVEGEAEVVDMEKIINEFAMLRNQWLGIIKALDQKQWQLTNIVKLRTAGLEDISL
jgi:anion-transporting  ArsA/GET3 family ATPase